jgi:hypothetical protein
MPAKAGIHDLPSLQQRKSWIPAGACPRALDLGAGITGHSGRVDHSDGWYKEADPRTLVPFSGQKFSAGSSGDCGHYLYDARSN